MTSVWRGNEHTLTFSTSAFNKELVKPLLCSGAHCYHSSLSNPAPACNLHHLRPLRQPRHLQRMTPYSLPVSNYVHGKTHPLALLQHILTVTRHAVPLLRHIHQRIEEDRKQRPASVDLDRDTEGMEEG